MDEPRKEGANRLELTWIGHATVLLEIGGLRVLTDPALGNRVFLLRRLATPVPRATVEEPDVILLSHAHADHLDLSSLRRVRGEPAILAPLAVAEWLRRHGIPNVRTVRSGKAMTVCGVEIEAVRAVHDGRRWPVGPEREAIGYVVNGGPRAYFAGDTDLYPEMAGLHGGIDVALLPVWGWGPTLGPGHMDPERAAEAAEIIAPRVAIPVHWGTIGLPWAHPSHEVVHAPARAFAAAVTRRTPDVEVRVLEPGESTTIDAVPVVRAPR